MVFSRKMASFEMSPSWLKLADLLLTAVTG